MGEIVVYGLLLVISGLFLFDVFHLGGQSAEVISRAIIIPLGVSIFNARKRTGHSLMVVLATFLIFLYFVFVYYMIGLPPKAPSIQVDHLTMTMNKTTAEQIHEAGYDMYVRQENASSSKYDEYLSSGDYLKYDWNRSITIKKGYVHQEPTMGYPTYILVKDGYMTSFELYTDPARDD